MRWYNTPIEDELSAEEYLERAKRFHRVAVGLSPGLAVRFEAMAMDALEIANRKTLERVDSV